MTYRKKNSPLFIFLLTLAALGCGTDATTEKDGTKTKKYVGPCKKQTFWHGATDAVLSLEEVFSYDEFGNILMVKMYGHDGSLLRTINYTSTYDERGNQLTEVTLSTPRSRWFDHERTFTYDDEDKLIQADMSLLERWRVHYIYDEKGRLVKEEWDQNATSIVNLVMLFSYDERGFMVTEDEDHGVNGHVDRRRTYTYDDRGNRLSESIELDADGIVNIITSYSYDEAGNLIRKEQVGSETTHWDYFYDCWEE
jgi:hypothetical protein